MTSATSFQSTPSGGKATRPGFCQVCLSTFQSTPSGGKATYHLQRQTLQRSVSIHAFRGEGDHMTILQPGQYGCFNPRLPGGRRRLPKWVSKQDGQVSIHAFRGEGDVPARGGRVVAHSFNPRLPGGRRPYTCDLNPHTIQFQSTPSGGKATPDARLRGRPGDVSIHAFRGEGDKHTVVLR